MPISPGEPLGTPKEPPDPSNADMEIGRTSFPLRLEIRSTQSKGKYNLVPALAETFKQLSLIDLKAKLASFDGATTLKDTTAIPNDADLFKTIFPYETSRHGKSACVSPRCTLMQTIRTWNRGVVVTRLPPLH